MNKLKLYERLSQLDCVKEEDAKLLGLKFYRMWGNRYNDYLKAHNLKHSFGEMLKFYNTRVIKVGVQNG